MEMSFEIRQSDDVFDDSRNEIVSFLYTSGSQKLIWVLLDMSTCKIDFPDVWLISKLHSFTRESRANVILENDSDPEGDALSITANASPQFGELVLNADGSFIYVPNAGFSGSDQFSYTITDGNGNEDSATVQITVTDESNNPPMQSMMR